MSDETARGGDFVALFQDEGRFGRISEVRASWAPAKMRPIVARQVVRESTCAYAAIAPAEGRMVTMLAPKCNTDGFDAFLSRTASAFEGRRIVMFLDGAGWRKAKRLNIPAGMRLEFLPPHTPECNPVEHLWDEVREKHFANQLFRTLHDVEVRLQTGLDEIAATHDRLKSLTNFPWIANRLLCL